VPRLYREIFGQLSAHVAERHERIGLPTALIQRPHERRPQPLASGVVQDQAAQFGHERVVRSLQQARIGERLDDTEVLLVQPRRLRLEASGKGYVCEGLTTPQVKRLPKQPGRLRAVARLQRALRGGPQVPKPQQVQLRCFRGQAVPARSSHQPGTVVHGAS
jgi:hypothetical protein